MFDEIRMATAEKLLAWALRVAPHNEDGAALVHCVGSYFAKALQKNIREQQTGSRGRWPDLLLPPDA